MGTNKLKPGDKVMFLGIYDNDPAALTFSEIDNLISMGIYEIRTVFRANRDLRYSLDLQAHNLRHDPKYFQKVEEDYGG